MKKITNTLIFLCSLASICIFIRDINIRATDRFLGDLSMVFVLLLPKIIRKLFKLKISNGMELIYVIFIILAQFFGSVINLYNTTWWYDLFTHFLSGVLTSILAVVILNWLKVYDDKNKLFNFLFIISFALMVASLWEFAEFLVDLIMKSDVQHALDTGVRDTMEDMIIAFLGNIIVSIGYLLNVKDGIIKKIVSAIE